MFHNSKYSYDTSKWEIYDYITIRLND
jgi:hypothetical protein